MVAASGPKPPARSIASPIRLPGGNSYTPGFATFLRQLKRIATQSRQGITRSEDYHYQHKRSQTHEQRQTQLIQSGLFLQFFRYLNERHGAPFPLEGMLTKQAYRFATVSLQKAYSILAEMREKLTRPCAGASSLAYTKDNGSRGVRPHRPVPGPTARWGTRLLPPKPFPDWRGFRDFGA